MVSSIPISVKEFGHLLQSSKPASGWGKPIGYCFSSLTLQRKLISMVTSRCTFRRTGFNLLALSTSQMDLSKWIENSSWSIFCRIPYSWPLSANWFRRYSRILSSILRWSRYPLKNSSNTMVRIWISTQACTWKGIRDHCSECSTSSSVRGYGWRRYQCSGNRTSCWWPCWNFDNAAFISSCWARWDYSYATLSAMGNDIRYERHGKLVSQTTFDST